jgi:hypothetical protein
MSIEVGKYYKRKDSTCTIFFSPIAGQDIYGSALCKILTIPDNPEIFEVISDPRGCISNLNYKEHTKGITEVTLEEFNAARELARSMI